MANSIQFYKYQGTGNDFVMIDNRSNQFPKENSEFIKYLCDRRFGIGGDGLILLENHTDADFRMVYFNADGNESSMCGNGGRCIVTFAHRLGIIKEKCSFLATDGMHEAEISGNSIKLKMKNVDTISAESEGFVLDTGSPHLVKYVENLENYDVFENGRKLRNSEKFKKEGINVNFVQALEDRIFVRTYERGVEDETLSCGTGATAAALTFINDKNLSEVEVGVPGGTLRIHARQDGETFKGIWLEGPAEFVFQGEIKI